MEREPETRKAVHQLLLRGELSFLLHDTQLAMADMVEKAESGEVLILCARQLGKSWFALCLALSYALKHPKVIVRVFAPTEVQATEIVDDNLRKIQELAPPGLITKVKSDKRWVLANKSELRIGPMSSAHIDGKRGGNASLIICEEGGFVRSEQYASAIGSVIGPQLLRSKGKLVHVTTPSEDVNHCLHSHFLPKLEPTGAVARYTVYDNPQLTPEQIKAAHDRCLTEEQWQREYMAQIIRSEVSTVVPEFGDEHVCEFEIPSHYHAWIAGDWGGVRDRTQFLLMAYDFSRAKILVLDEAAFEKHTTTSTIVAAVKAMEARWKLGNAARFVDCPGQLQVDLMREHNFPVALPKKDVFEASINFIRGSVRNLEIHPRCKQLIRTLRYARLNKSRTDFERTEALGHADAIMALCYGLRHANTQNPFPRYGGQHPSLIHIPEHHLRPQSQSAQVLKSLFTVK